MTQLRVIGLEDDIPQRNPEDAAINNVGVNIQLGRIQTALDKGLITPDEVPAVAYFIPEDMSAEELGIYLTFRRKLDGLLAGNTPATGQMPSRPQRIAAKQLRPLDD